MLISFSLYSQSPLSPPSHYLSLSVPNTQSLLKVPDTHIGMCPWELSLALVTRGLSPPPRALIHRYFTDNFLPKVETTNDRLKLLFPIYRLTTILSSLPPLPLCRESATVCLCVCVCVCVRASSGSTAFALRGASGYRSLGGGGENFSSSLTCCSRHRYPCRCVACQKSSATSHLAMWPPLKSFCSKEIVLLGQHQLKESDN